ncbi:amidohydrolase family protein [Flagellimonas flava]|uniref:Amidohydrolase family protein n=1 Tax=Flagellimonas flava TaxID=570519 RepID=A0A1M5JYJ5_9FLAO|nr:amidohydrolase family protein [Allomuricauda flava]SHG45667.1 Amidohydrolase family protein [Allomuricauda flava]
MKGILRGIFLAILFGSTSLSCKHNPKIKGDLLLTNVNIIDIQSGEIDYGQQVVIEGNRITHRLEGHEESDFEAIKTVNAGNKFLIPGLWDMHTHPDDPEVWRMQPPMEAKDRLLPLFVIHGVTGIRDMGGDLNLVKRWREQYSDGKLLAPKIFACGPLLDGPNPMWDGSAGIDGPEKVEQVVDSLMAEGIDFLKVYSLLPRDTYMALSRYANSLDFPFVGHVPFTVLPSEAANTGMKSQEHLLEILKECSAQIPDKLLKEIRGMKDGVQKSVAANNFRIGSYDAGQANALFGLFAEKEIWHCPTLSMWQKNAWFEEELKKDKELFAYLPKYLQAYWTPKYNDHLQNRDNQEYINVKKRLYQLYLEMVRDMHNKGVMLLAGTDMGANPLCFPGIGLHNELKTLVQAGLSPHEALKTATTHPVDFLEIEEDYGSVEVGKVADLVLLDKNPLDNIANLQYVFAVLRDGKFIGPKEIQEIKTSTKAVNAAGDWTEDELK